MSEAAKQWPTETVPVLSLKRHPRNYREHRPEQVAHIVASIRQHGFYRNVVIANDNTILAGHGVVAACKEMGLDAVPVVRLDIAPDSPLALKLLTGDNEISRGADTDDRVLAEILRDVMDGDPMNLIGTGYDDK